MPSIRTRTFQGRRGKTSIRLEDVFWQALKSICARDGVSLRLLMDRIQRQREAEGRGVSLASATRCYILQQLPALTGGDREQAS